MLIDIQGKINEKRLSFNNTLLPLFEAVVNSIHAIEEDSATKPGIIDISIIRSSQKNIDLEGGEQLQIIGFDVKDNGVGFNERNFSSFNYAHSTYKSKKGGKGIGRFIWLRAFQKAEIESKYRENNLWFLRTFNFEPTQLGIEKHKLEELRETDASNQRFTTVRLKNLKEPYWKWCNNNLEDIAFKIIEHCFIYFLDDKSPRVILHDKDQNVVVNDLFYQFTQGQVKNRSIEVAKHQFDVKIVKLYHKRVDNKIHFVAHAREVENIDLNKVIPELDAFMLDDKGEKFSIGVYVTSSYFDERVNDERTKIQFLEKTVDAAFFDELHQDELIESILTEVKDEFAENLTQLERERADRITNFVVEHPQYKQLLKYKPNQVKKISARLPDDKLELELFKVKQELDFDLRKEANDVYTQIERISNLEEINSFKEQHASFYQKVIEVGNSKLSEYILYRKFVLGFLEKHLKKSDEGKFSKEEIIHKLIFPLKSESEDIGYDEHNLWIIDERLAFHQYLASDKSFKQNKVSTSNSIDRPDLLIFNKPFALSDSEKPYPSIVLIEFKRPMRDDYADDENPISQITKYTRELIQNKIVDKSGRQFDLRPNTPIYSFIICDLTPKLRDKAEENSFIKFPDNDGYFMFNPNYSLYIEIISFDKLIRDSKQRNKALFDKLSISSI